VKGNREQGTGNREQGTEKKYSDLLVYREMGN
jgi:hypothetical protein